MPRPLIDPSQLPNLPVNDPASINPPVNPVRYDNSGRVNADLENQVDRASAYQDIFNQQFRNEAPYFWQMLQQYGPAALSAYQQILAGEGGYSPEESAAIMDNERLSRMDFRPDEYAAQFLTPDEQSAIAGDPYKIFDYFNPDAIRGQWSDFRDRGREAISGADLGVDPGYAGRLRSILSRTGADADVNEDALRLRSGFLDEFQMGDDEVRDLANLGARTASSRWDAAYDETARRAGAAGTMSPAALAVLRDRLDRRSNIDAADASTRATLEGKGLQRSLLGQGEQMRLGSEQFIQDALLDRAFNLGGMALGAEGDIEGRRYQGEIDRLNAALGHETNVGGMGLGMEQDLQRTGQDLFQYGDMTTSDRNRYLGENRQGATRYGQEAARNYGFGVSDRMSGRAQATADARRQDEQEARGFLQNQQQFGGEMYNQARSDWGQNVTDITNSALGGSSDRRQRRGPGFWERLALG